jgi:tyrosyl-tRNA synthetase
VTDTSKAALDRFFERGIETVYPSREALTKALKSGKQLKFYLGADPSRPDLHIGHAVILRRMRVLQQMGHKVIFLIGDFTGMIGDPTDKSAARSQMTREEVAENAKTYKQQIRKILDFGGDNPAEIVFNAKWLAKLSFEDLINLAAKFTVQQMLERDMYQNRLKEEKPIYLHEFFYPLMQGYDSVAMEVDGEFGGSDQLFNMMAGRTLMKELKQKEKFVITGQLLLGTDGRKMSKSFNNYIGINDTPKDMYGKIMSIRDELIGDYFRLCTDVSLDALDTIHAELAKPETNPRDLKMRLARLVTTEYHGEQAAQTAESGFVAQFQKGEMPEDMPECVVDAATATLIDLLTAAGLAASRGEAKRLVQQGGVRVDGAPGGTDPNRRVDLGDPVVIQVGKLKYIRFRRG